MRKVKIAIIGAGSAGLSAQRQVSKFTDDYIVIDNGILGTTCARVGCMPSKVLIQVANDFHRRKKFDQTGITGAENLTIDRKKVMKYVRKLRDRFVRGVISDVEQWKETHLIQKRAQFIDRNTLDLGDEKIQADQIIIATGSTPIVPKPWHKFQDYLVDTNSFFELRDLPQKMAVIGLGVIGIELGQALHRLDVDVIGISRSKSIGGITDPIIRDYIAKKLSEEMNLNFNGVDRLEKADGKIKIHSGSQSYSVDKILVSTGRSPNVKGLGLENLDIELDDRGVPLFNVNTTRIQNSNLFLIGDVNADRPILHEASDEGSIAGYNAVHDANECFRRRTLLGVTFSSPNIAFVGERYQSLKDKGIAFEVGKVSFEGQGRSIVKLQEVGLLHVYGCKNTGKILGAELFAPDGEHLAHLLAWVIDFEKTVHHVLNLPFYHPVVEEGLRTAFRHLAKKIDADSPPLETLRCQDTVVL